MWAGGVNGGSGDRHHCGWRMATPKVARRSEIMVGMELPRRADGLVEPLAVVRSIRDVSHKTLAARVGVDAETVYRWECGEESIPSTAMMKRLGLALGWAWCDLASPPKPMGEAWQTVLAARQAIASTR